MEIEEIEVPRWLVVTVVATLVVVGMATLGFLGWANSPLDPDGRPLLLNPERRAILRYLDAAAAWADRLAEVGVLLDGLMPPELPSDADDADSALPTVPAPAEQSADLYRQTHEARQAFDALQELAQEMERARTPDALIGLHELVGRALEAHLAWADGVLVYVGAPEAVNPAELARLRDDAQAALSDLEETLH